MNVFQSMALIIMGFIVNQFITVYIYKQLNDNAEKEKDKKKRDMIRQKVKRITKNKALTDLIYNAEEYFYLNPRVFNSIIANIEYFLELYEISKIDVKTTNELYFNLKNMKRDILNDFMSLTLKNRDSSKNLNLMVLELEKILNGYLDDVYKRHEDMLKKEGLNYKTKLIFPKDVMAANEFKTLVDSHIETSYFRV